MYGKWCFMSFVRRVYGTLYVVWYFIHNVLCTVSYSALPSVHCITNYCILYCNVGVLLRISAMNHVVLQCVCVHDLLAGSHNT